MLRPHHIWNYKHPEFWHGITAIAASFAVVIAVVVLL